MKKSDKILIAVIIIIGVLALGSVVFCSFGCERKPQDNRTVRETDSIDSVVYCHKKSSFNFDCIEDMVLSESYFIEYNDPDRYDYDNLAHWCEMDKWYGEYIIVDCDSALFYEIHREWAAYVSAEQDMKDSLNQKYSIYEKWLPSVTNFLWWVERRQDD